MTGTCKEDNSLNYQEIKCVNIEQIITATNCQTLKFDYLYFIKSDFDSMALNSQDIFNLYI